MAESKQQSTTGFVDNWQTDKSLADCNLRMLLEEDSCDVTFRCGREGHVVKAHRYMLISRSCVFHAMFAGPMAETSEVTIPEIEPEILKAFLRYLYTNDSDVDAENATALLYSARKYGVGGLENKCTELLGKNLDKENACVILEASHQYDLTELFERALNFIKRNGDKSLQSPGFSALSHTLMDKLVESDDLIVDEHVVFNAANSWAEAECRRKGREITPKAKREVLGETMLKIRFPNMNQQFIVQNVKESGLLTESERLQLLENSICPENVQPFTTSERVRNQNVGRNRFKTDMKYWKFVGCMEAISFQSNKDLIIFGCSLYGRTNEKYKVATYFGNDVKLSVMQEETLYYSRNNENMFDVLFPNPVRIKAGIVYTLAVKMIGPSTNVGSKGSQQVTCDDKITLTFINSSQSRGGTNVNRGQIPSLIFKPYKDMLCL